MTRLPLTLALLAAALAVPAAAQEDLEPLWRLPRGAAGASDVEARSLQLYRIPISFSLRDTKDHAWGLDLTLPLTLGGYDVSAVLVDSLFSEQITTYTFVPGLELRIPAGAHWMVKPFAEAGVSGGDGGGGDLLWGAGARARGCFDSGRLRWTLGGAAEYRSGGGDRSLVEHYSQLAAFADVQTRLDFTVGGLATRAGVFAGYRFLTDATLRTLDADDLEVRHQVETGLSFSTTPALKVWFVSIPWIGVAYRTAGALSGVRLYLAFPL
jgi:hypothetical protein